MAACFYLCLLSSAIGGQLPYGPATDQDLGLPSDLISSSHLVLPEAIPGRRIPDVVTLSSLAASDLSQHSVPLPQANTLAHIHFQQRHFGRLQNGNGTLQFFNPEFILVKFRGHALVSALRVEPMRELESVQILNQRPDVEFAVLDTFERRQFIPNDPAVGSQWHHQLVGSYQAWNYSLGSSSVQVAIVDAPFQMDHPDLAANTVSGWDVDANQPVTASAGIVHSTMCAGMAAAAINNSAGVAGAANCRILPININGSISEMYNATIWAANHGVRVVNISWSGATNPILEAAGYYLKTNSAGLLIMSATDGSGIENGPNQPDVWVVSMTDSADNFEVTRYGPYIDFAAPGYQIYSTTTGGGYASGSGCSYAAPLVAGIVAWMFGVNPTLRPDDVISILTNTAVAPGLPVWNEFYGWGRVNFGAAAAATVATLPLINSVHWSNQGVSISANFRAGPTYSLWRSPNLVPAGWGLVSNATILTNANYIVLTDPSPPAGGAFYRLSEN